MSSAPPLAGTSVAAEPSAGTPANPGARAPAQPEALAAPAAAPATTPTHCENCGAAVTQKFCGACGQRVEPPVHSLWHFLHVALEDLTHADSRLWRTLAALLIRPGFLTREFLCGRRARYLPPVRLYLVVSALFFLWASAVPHQSKLLQISVSDRGTASAGMKELCAPGEAREQCAQRVCNNAAYQGPWRHFVVTTAHELCVRTVLDNGRSEREAILHSLPRAMFFFLPLLAAAMMLIYWRPRHYYIEHLLLFVHNHACVFLLLLLAGIVSVLLPPVSSGVSLAVTLYVAWYAYRSMRVVYGQGRWLTVVKLAALSFFYVVAGSLMLALTSLLSVLTA